MYGIWAYIRTFQGFEPFFEARIWIRIRISVKSRIRIRIRKKIRIRIRIRVVSLIRIRINVMRIHNTAGRLSVAITVIEDLRNITIHSGWRILGSVECKDRCFMMSNLLVLFNTNLIVSYLSYFISVCTPCWPRWATRIRRFLFTCPGETFQLHIFVHFLWTLA